MKQIILTLLRTGFSSTKKYRVKDLCNYLYFLKYIFEDIEPHSITCKRNPFWNPENNKNRCDLLSDITGIHKANVTDSLYFTVLNRFENGDKYGIEIKGE